MPKYRLNKKIIGFSVLLIAFADTSMARSKKISCESGELSCRLQSRSQEVRSRGRLKWPRGWSDPQLVKVYVYAQVSAEATRSGKGRPVCHMELHREPHTKTTKTSSPVTLDVNGSSRRGVIESTRTVTTTWSIGNQGPQEPIEFGPIEPISTRMRKNKNTLTLRDINQTKPGPPEVKDGVTLQTQKRLQCDARTFRPNPDLENSTGSSEKETGERL